MSGPARAWPTWPFMALGSGSRVCVLSAVEIFMLWLINIRLSIASSCNMKLTKHLILYEVRLTAVWYIVEREVLAGRGPSVGRTVYRARRTRRARARHGVCPLGECERRTRNRRVTTVSSTGNFLAPPRSGALAMALAARRSRTPLKRSREVGGLKPAAPKAAWTCRT